MLGDLWRVAPEAISFVDGVAFVNVANRCESTGRCYVLLGFTGFYWVLLGFTGFHCVLLGFTGFYRVLSDLLVFFSQFYWVLSSSNEKVVFNLCLTRFY